MKDTASIVLTDQSRPKEIEFSSEFIQQKFSHKEGTFKCAISDRSAKSYASEHMQSRRCVTTTSQGLVCLLEDDAVNFYASNSILDPQISEGASHKSQLY